MEFKKNMYVRTKSFENFPSKIGRITKIEYNAGIDNETYIALDNDEDKNRRWTEDWLIGEPSFNIIELIEPMDLMYIDISPDNCGGIVVPRIAETLNELDKWKERFSNGSCVLKGVVTREQLENNIYRIGE